MRVSPFGVLFLCLASCVTSTGPEGSAQERDDALTVDAGAHCHEQALLMLHGVTCPSCREVVVASLLAVPGVVSAQVSLSPQEAKVVHCDTVDPDDLVRAVEKAGYQASVEN